LRWHEVTIRTTEQAAEIVSHYLLELGAGGVAIEESGTLSKQRDTSLGQWYELPLNDIPEGHAVVQAYFPEEENAEEIVKRLGESIAESGDYGIEFGDWTIEAKRVDDEDWADAWKKYFKPLRISDRLTVKPTWEDYTAGPGEIVVELDPGMAFGTGTHATTMLCMRALEQAVQEGDDVIDVGTGSGILAITAIRLGARHVLALDLDPVAVSSARENASLNGLSERITIRQSDLLQVLDPVAMNGDFGSLTGLGARFPVRVVVANILSEIIVMFIDDVYRALAIGGKYVVSGVIAEKREMVEQALVASGFAIEEVYGDQGWVAIVAGK
jgi:ribosomal protein L11 methyltransferase